MENGVDLSDTFDCIDHNGLDLSDAFDCIDHNTLIVKPNAKGLGKRLLEFMISYLNKRTQKTKPDSTFSPWEILFSDVTRGSILEALLFNIYIYDMFSEISR